MVVVVVVVVVIMMFNKSPFLYVGIGGERKDVKEEKKIG